MTREASGPIRQGLRKLECIEDWVACYLGNGVIGGCFDYSGLQFQDGAEGRPDIIGDTYFVSQYHYVHGKFGMDYALPIGRLQACIRLDGCQVEPSPTQQFTELDQVLDIDQGVLRTSYMLGCGARVDQTQFFSQARKNLFVLRALCGHPMEFAFRPVDKTGYHYGSQFEAVVAERELDCCRVYKIPTNLQTTAIALRQDGDLVLVSVYSTLEAEDPAGACAWEIQSALGAGFDELLREQVEWWQSHSQESEVRVPGRLGGIWRRANYYIGCSLSDEKSHPPLVFGLARVQWPAYFPQDFFYAYRNALTANHLRQSSSTSAFWRDILPNAQEYAARLFGLDGAVYPWTPPVLDWQDYHKDGETPNWCYYEMHNSAYVAKMCWDYYEHTRDEAYLREKAWPVIREIARMYASLTTIKDGRAQILYRPIFSQDEGSPRDMPNYFDALVSAEYTLTLARECASRFEDSAVERMCDSILSVGYGYDLLEFGDTYAVFEGDTRTDDFQKHPVQLNPITWLPISRFLGDERVLTYHKRRYEICKGYRDASSTAWTLGQFMLASCRLRLPEELANDIGNIQRCRIMDPDYIQTFESSRRSPHFLTTIGLFMQAITETVLQTHNGYVELFPCLLPEWREERIEFHRLRTPGAFLVSASWQDGLEWARVESMLGGQFRFSVCGETRGVRVVDSEGCQCYSGPQVVTVETTKGMGYDIEPLRETT